MSDPQVNDIERLINRPGFNPEHQGARFWYEACMAQCQVLLEVEKELDTIKESLCRLTHRSCKNRP